MAGYIRQDVTNQIENGNVIDAIPLDAEFNALQGAFAASGGHTHDGSTGAGAPITVVGPVQDVVVSSNSVTPKTDNTINLGSSSLEFKDLYIDGVANIDSLVADTADINAGTIDNTIIGATTPAALSATTVSALTVAANGATFGNLSATTLGVGGAAVTTTSNTQSLTNKTLNLSNNTLVATSAQLAAAVTDETGTGALVFAGSPALTGVPTTPTAAVGTDTTQVASTAFVQAERSSTATLTNKTLTSPTINGGTITSITDLAVADGGTGASTASQALINFGLTATAVELNTLDGITTTTAELNALDGVTAAGTTLIVAADAAAQRTALGLGTAALLAAGGNGGAGVIGTAAGEVAVRDANGVLDALARGVVRYTAVDATGLLAVVQTIPAWVNKIEIQMRGLSHNVTTASISLQATVGGVAVASNYFSTNTSLTNATNPALSSQTTTAAVLPPVTGTSVMTGDMILTRLGSTNTWLWKSKATGLAVGVTFETSGVIDLAGPLDGIRLFPSAGNWDAGIVAIEGRA